MTIVGLDDNKKLGTTELYDETKKKTQAEINAANTSIKTITLSASKWSSAAPYTQTVEVEGITQDMIPIPMLDTRTSANLSAEKNMKKSYGYLTFFETFNGSIKVTAKYEKPTVDLAIILKGG